MKNTFFSIFILSSTLLYSSDFKVNITQKNEYQPIHKQLIYFSILDEDEIDLEEEKAYLNDINCNQQYSTDGWNAVKGLVGLWIGLKGFSYGSNGIIYALMLSKLLQLNSRSKLYVSEIEMFILKHRLLWLSLCCSLIALSVWIIKESGTNLYKGVYPKAYGPEYF